MFGFRQNTLSIIKNYPNLYLICTFFFFSKKMTRSSFLKTIVFSFPSSFFIESQGKINGMGIIFNLGVKWVSGEIRTGKQGKEQMELNINDQMCRIPKELSCLFFHLWVGSEPNLFSFLWGHSTLRLSSQYKDVSA